MAVHAEELHENPEDNRERLVGIFDDNIYWYNYD
jgi:hypothetical protein